MAFYIVATIIIISAILTVTRTNPIISALWLVICLFAQAALFVILDAHLVAALQVLLYAGAIMVLILFVIMLLNLSPKKLKFKTILGERIIIGMGAFYLAGVIGMAVGIIYKNVQTVQTVQRIQGTVEAVGTTLFTKYLVPFELVSVVLLSAIVGAVVLVRKRS